MQDKPPPSAFVPCRQSNSKKTSVNHVKNILLKRFTKGRETLIVKIPIDRARQPPSPGLSSLSRTASNRSSMNEDGTDFMFKKPHMHFFIRQNRRQIGPQLD
jgi:hypothetical protein